MQEYNQQDLELSYKNIMNVGFIYLDHMLREIQALTKKESLDELERYRFTQLHQFCSMLLDITHRGYPICYKMFDKKENLDNIYDLYKKFEDGKILNHCPCEWCKEKNPKEEVLVEVDKKPDSASLENVN